jgi:hypothetical protein
MGKEVCFAQSVILCLLHFYNTCIAAKGNNTSLEGNLRSRVLHLWLLWWLGHVLSTNEINEKVKISFIHLHEPS